MYLSLLVDIELAAMAALSIHKIDIATLTTQRMLVEYAAKAEYFAKASRLRALYDDNR